MSIYLDPTNDVAFKKVFNDESRMKHFLNAILRLKGDKMIKNIIYIPPEQVPDYGQLKRSIVDIKCIDIAGNVFIVEMQNGYAPNIIKRAQYYASSALVKQLKYGNSMYTDLMPVIVVLILTDLKPIHDDNLDVITYHHNIESTTKKSYFNLLSYTVVELSRFKKHSDELTSFEDEWLYFLSQCKKDRMPPEHIHSKEVTSAYDAVNQLNWSEEQIEDYEKTMLYLQSEKIAMIEKFEDGILQGLERGREEVREEGLKNGKEITSISNAKKLLLTQKLSDQEVADCSGLTLEKILELKAEINN
jgi:predicted transposase/invertase (TIGR01784 family)